MRCRFCGSTSIHPAEERRNFSTGKAIAGTVVFGPMGAVAGLDGKKVKGYRCAQCGSFMDSAMDHTTESMVNDAIYEAKKGSKYSMYDYYKKQYPNIENVTNASAAQSDKTLEIHRNNDRRISSAQITGNENAKIKRTYFYGFWQPECPVYIQSIIIKTLSGEDLLSLRIINQAEKTIRSLYLQVTVLDDAGDLLTVKNCVYQGVNIKSGDLFPDNKSFELETDLAYRIEVFCEKAVFEDDTVWRGSDDVTLLKIELPETIDENTFPRFKYLLKEYEKQTGTTTANRRLKEHRKNNGLVYPRYMISKNDGYWFCTCGIPVKIDSPCPFCKCEYDALQKIMSQEFLQQMQRKEVKERAVRRAEETLIEHDEAINAYCKREQEIQETKYRNAVRLMGEGTVDSIMAAINEFSDIGNYKDSEELLAFCKKLLVEKQKEEDKAAEIRKTEEERRDKQHKRLKLWAVLGVIALIGAVIAAHQINSNKRFQNDTKAFLSLIEANTIDEVRAACGNLGGTTGWGGRTLYKCSSCDLGDIHVFDIWIEFEDNKAVECRMGVGKNSGEEVVKILKTRYGEEYEQSHWVEKGSILGDENFTIYRWTRDNGEDIDAWISDRSSHKVYWNDED